MLSHSVQAKQLGTKNWSKDAGRQPQTSDSGNGAALPPPCSVSCVLKKGDDDGQGVRDVTAQHQRDHQKVFNSHGHLSVRLFKGLVKAEDQLRSGKLTWQAWAQNREPSAPLGESDLTCTANSTVIRGS